MKEFFRSITKVTLAFVLILFLSGCGTGSVDPEATLPEIGPSPIEDTLPEIGLPPVEEMSSTTENLEITSAEIEEETLTPIDESTKETFEEEETSSESELSSEEVESSEIEQTTVVESSEEKVPETTKVVQETTAPSLRFTFTDMSVHMYAQASVYVRSLPSTEGNVVFVLDVNDMVYVTGKCNETGWYRIDVEGQTFYVTYKYIGQNKVAMRSTAAVTPTTTVSHTSSGFVYYKVAGVGPNRDYEVYLYNQLNSLGISWWYPYAVAQIFQESRWNPSATNGKDHGICQFKGIYFAGRAKSYAGMSNADIWNPYDSLKVYAYYIKAILRSHGNDVNRTLSFYICGDDSHWDQAYIDHVMGWYKQLQR